MRNLREIIVEIEAENEENNLEGNYRGIKNVMVLHKCQCKNIIYEWCLECNIVWNQGASRGYEALRLWSLTHIAHENYEAIQLNMKLENEPLSNRWHFGQGQQAHRTVVITQPRWWITWQRPTMRNGTHALTRWGAVCNLRTCIIKMQKKWKYYYVVALPYLCAWKCLQWKYSNPRLACEAGALSIYIKVRQSTTSIYARNGKTLW